MRQPLWMVNSILLVLVVLALLFIYFSQISIPEREDVKPSPAAIARKKDKRVHVNISKIYEADLFGSYQMATERPGLEAEAAFPQPPEPQSMEIPELPVPQFLDPLDITLKGIFIINNDGTKNRAIISDNKTKKEDSHKIGDKIGDAQLIRIFGNKILLLRSNGQQEVVYLREQDAKLDAGYSMINEWSLVVKPISNTNFLVDPAAFSKRVQDLGNLIEMLHLITAYKQGISMGCRIGKMDEKSVGVALGLQPGDIITMINGIPADTMANRLKIYQSVLGKKSNELVVVQLLRNKADMVLEYQLRDLLVEGQKETPQHTFALQKIEADEKRKILQQKYEFAPTIQEIRNRERLNMLQKSSAPQP